MAKKDRIRDLISVVEIKLRDAAKARNAENKAALDKYVATINPMLINKARKQFPIPKQAVGTVRYNAIGWGASVLVQFEVKSKNGPPEYEGSVRLTSAAALKAQARVDEFYARVIDTTRQHGICESIAASLYMNNDATMQVCIEAAINEHFAARAK